MNDCCSVDMMRANSEDDEDVMSSSTDSDTSEVGVVAQSSDTGLAASSVSLDTGR